MTTPAKPRRRCSRPSSLDMAASPTSPRSMMEVVNGSDPFVIQGYSLAKVIGLGKHTASKTFTVGGYTNGRSNSTLTQRTPDSSAYVSVFIALSSEGSDFHALFGLPLQGQSGEGKHKVNSYLDSSLESGTYTLKYRFSMW